MTNPHNKTNKMNTITTNELKSIEFPLHNIYLEGEEIYESNENYYIGKYELSYELRIDASYAISIGDWYTPECIDLKNYDITIENIVFGPRNDDDYELGDEEYEIIKDKIIKSLNVI